MGARLATFTEQEFELEHLTLRARVWGQGRAHKVIALHGWLDNSASFNWLAPLLDAHVVALDTAGHGLSDYRNVLAPYNIWEDAAEIFAVADQLGWEQFTLVGHSRGAMVSMIMAGSWPERITDLVLLDGMFPEFTPEEKAPEQLQKSIRSLLSPHRKRATVYQTWDAAIAARMNSMWAVERSTSEALAERGVKAVEGGYIWQADPKLQLPSAVKLTKGFVQAYLRGIEANTLLIVAEEGIAKQFENSREQLEFFPKIDVKTLPGKHHFHMEGQAPAIAELINAQLSGG